jgi:hypothetical protein
MLYNIKMKKISNKLIESDNELIVNLIQPPKPKVDRKMKRNENNEPVKKNGEPMKRSTKGLEALARYRENKKKAKLEKEQKIELKDDSESDEDDEYEIEAVEVKKIEPKIIEKEVEVIKEVEKIVEKPVEVVKPDLNVVKENHELKEKNKKLENLFEFNTHLSRISNMSRSTNLKF